MYQSTGAHRGQKRTLGPFEPRVVVGCPIWVLGTELGSSGGVVSAVSHSLYRIEAGMTACFSYVSLCAFKHLVLAWLKAFQNILYSKRAVQFWFLGQITYNGVGALAVGLVLAVEALGAEFGSLEPT